MKSLIVFCITAVLALGCFEASALAQDVLSGLSEEQISEGKKLREEYTSEKEELQIQLQKLIKDRDIAIRDKNTSLVEKRNREIKQTREKIKNLPKEYNSQFSDMLTDEQKEDKITDDFYSKEMAAELEKMKKAESKDAAAASAAKKPAAKKSAPAKKSTKKK